MAAAVTGLRASYHRLLDRIELMLPPRFRPFYNHPAGNGGGRGGGWTWGAAAWGGLPSARGRCCLAGSFASGQRVSAGRAVAALLVTQTGRAGQPRNAR